MPAGIGQAGLPTLTRLPPNTLVSVLFLIEGDRDAAEGDSWTHVIEVRHNEDAIVLVATGRALAGQPAHRARLRRRPQ